MVLDVSIFSRIFSANKEFNSRKECTTFIFNLYVVIQ